MKLVRIVRVTGTTRRHVAAYDTRVPMGPL